MFTALRSLCFSLILLSSSSMADSIMIECHFVPYSNCHLEITYSSPESLKNAGFSNSKIFIVQDVVLLHPGLYSSTLSLRSKDRSEIERFEEFYFRVRDNRVYFDRHFSNSLELKHFKSVANSGAIQTAVLKTQRIPLIVPDPEVKKGNIEVSIYRKGDVVSHSKAYLEPYDGCWFDEQQCVERHIQPD